MLEGAVIALVFLLAGIQIGRRLPPRQAVPKVACSCGHRQVMHVYGSGACEYLRVRRFGFLWARERTVACGCQHYDGPGTAMERYAREVQL